MNTVDRGRPALFWVRVLLRFLQFAFSLTALITLSAAFVSTSSNGYTRMLGSSPVIFATLMTYTGMVVGLWFLIFIEILRMCLRPKKYLEQVMDFLMALLLMIAAIVLVTSDYMNHCSRYEGLLRCNSLTTAVVFTFLAMAAFLATLLLSFIEKRDEYDNDLIDDPANPHHHHMAGTGGRGVDDPAPYHAGATPTARDNGPMNPAARV